MSVDGPSFWKPDGHLTLDRAVARASSSSLAARFRRGRPVVAARCPAALDSAMAVDPSPASRDGRVTIDVAPEVLRHVGAGDRAIARTMQRLPDGIGNQRQHVVDSQGVSFARAELARDLMPQGTLRRGQVAWCAAFVGGGNAGEVAAMTYCDLIAEGGLNAPIQAVWLPEQDHALTWIGDPRATDDVVAVDAWPTTPQALRWVDTRWAEGLRDGGEARVVETWNDARPNPKFALPDVPPTDLDAEGAARLLHLPTGQSLLDALRARPDAGQVIRHVPFAASASAYVRYRGR